MDKPAVTGPIKIDSVFDTLLTDDDPLLNRHIEESYPELTSLRMPRLELIPGWLLTIHRILAWIRLRLGAHDEENRRMLVDIADLRKEIAQLRAERVQS